MTHDSKPPKARLGAAAMAAAIPVPIRPTRSQLLIRQQFNMTAPFQSMAVSVTVCQNVAHINGPTVSMP